MTDVEHRRNFIQGRVADGLPAEIHPVTLRNLMLEVEAAREKFPSPDKLLAALMEEVGELAQALLQDRPFDEIQREAMQVAAVACRIAEEGDADFDVKNWKATP